ncbi:MAG: START domain-containing protein [Gammaproteobacteria bacterium]|nr:START domain-containing protein [Gammaproteobacteria bacterium]
MMAPLRISLVLVLCFAAPGLTYVSDDDWKLVSRKDADVLVYTKNIEGQKIKAIKAETMLDLPIRTLMTVLSDDELVPKWVPVIATAQLLQETDPDGVSIMHMATRFPWPIKNRDAVVKTVTEYDHDTDTIYMESTGISGYVEERRSHIRIPATYTKWKIALLEDGNLQVELITHSDPGGSFPKWMMNMLIDRTPKRMFRKLEKLVAKEEKKGRTFDEVFIFGKQVGI